MSTTSAVTTHLTGPASPISTPLVSANVKANVTTVSLLVGVALLALMVYYVVGVDEGATSVFGKSMVIHEFFHDGRHFLGFPCH